MVNSIDLQDTIIRLLIAFLMGGAIGMERQLKKSSAGLRTHILVCLGSALLVILGLYLSAAFPSQNGDIAARIVAGVVTGIGFLGAGTIMKNQDQTVGLTTAASVWISSAIGLTVGAGFFDVALVATLLTIFTLFVLKKLEKSNGT